MRRLPEREKIGCKTEKNRERMRCKYGDIGVEGFG